MSFWERLKNPSNELRPLPFWSWNDCLEAEELKNQISSMKQSGMGGYFMHARGGLETEYLSEDWMEAVKTGIAEGKTAGLRPWIYDEEGWPSGFAGGKVTALGDEYHARGLRWRTIDDNNSPENRLCTFKLPDGTSGEVYHTSCKFYIDVMNSEAVRAFLESTHEKYYEKFGENFGKGLQGFFTDEPRFAEGEVPWSYLLPDAFYKTYGYELTPCLPSLFFPFEGYEAVRHDFWKLANEMFVSSFMKQIYDWCDAHNCLLTGHVMMEESLYSQMRGTGGSMPFYEFMHIPGVDWLRRTMGNQVMSKQVGSAAEQLGKKQVLTESFALCGWDVRPEELRWLAAWQFVNGVNLMCQHLEGYTLRGLRKRDYPPSLFTQLPWWEEYGVLNDWFSGMGAALTQGSKQVNILVLHPMRSGFLAYDGTNSPVMKELDASLAACLEKLSSFQLDYHLGDETLIARHGAVSAEGKLTIGKGSYSAVVIPRLLTIGSDTLRLLEDFARSGGLIYALAPLPKLVDGRPDCGRIAALPIVEYCKDEHLVRILSSVDSGRVRVTSSGAACSDVRTCRYEDGENRVVFLVNLSKSSAQQSEILIDGCYDVYKAYPESGEREAVTATIQGGVTSLSYIFAPMETLLLYCEPSKAETQKTAKTPVLNVMLNPQELQVKEMSNNALTLDGCEYRVDGGEWQPRQAVIHLFKELLKLRRPCDLEMRFSFEVGCDTASIPSMYLVLETPERFEIDVNGAAIEYSDHGFVIDKAFRKTDILKYLRSGHNVVNLRVNFYQAEHVYQVLFGEGVYETELNKLTYDTELESIYLFGDFGVYSQSPFEIGERNTLFTDGSFIIDKSPSRFYFGKEFTQQGLLFFSGRVTVACKFQVPDISGARVILKLPRVRAAAVSLSVNGKNAGTMLWSPYEVDITEVMLSGENDVEITLVSGNRNLLGPHHHIDGEIYSVGPASFSGDFSWCEHTTEAINIPPTMRGKSYWREGYSFVTFGLLE